MALPLYRELLAHGAVRQDELARAFADAYAAEPHRGYGSSMHDVLLRFGTEEGWRTVTTEQFSGMGSWGNGAAMRVAPLGAWFAADPGLAAEQAALSAAVTHSHPEAAAGAVAVAVAAALAARGEPADRFIAAVADVDTTCAIAGGIVAARTGTAAMPAAWLDACEPLPAWTDGPAMR